MLPTNQMNPLCLFLILPMALAQPFFYYTDFEKKQYVSNLQFTPIDISCDSIDSCSECLSNSCLWCQSTLSCFNPIHPFSCPSDRISTVNLISDQLICKAVIGTSSACHLKNSCSSCLQAGCKWCDGDGSGTYPAICTAIRDPVNCSYDALHVPGTPSGTCNCTAATSCHDCMLHYGCAWCDGDGGLTHPPMCLNPQLPFGCSSPAYHPPGSIC